LRFVGRDHNDLGQALQRLGDRNGARMHYERALAIFEATLGVQHPSTAMGRRNISVLQDLAT